MALANAARIDAPQAATAAPSPIPAWRVLLIMTTLATAVISPMLFLGNASGHDFQFHIASWMDVARQWHSGVIFPRWANWANFGFGEPRFIFYPPVSWILGSALGSALPWKMAPGALIWLCVTLAGISMFHFTREWLSPAAAVAAGAFYAVNPYHLVMIYYRSDFAELLASAVLPLAVLFALRLARGGAGNIASLALVFAFIWLSNAPAAVVISYSLALVLLVESLVRKSPRVLLRGAVGLSCGLGLAAFYIVPAAWEQEWVDITQVISQNLHPEQNFLFTHANDPEFVLFNWKVSSVALAVIGISAIAAVFSSRLRREERSPVGEVWWPLAALGIVCVAMMFPPAETAWRLLPKLRFVQFPWRWLVPLNVVCWFFFARATARSRRAWAWWAAMGLATAILAGAIVRDAWWDSEDVPALLSAVSSGQGYEGTDEYAPKGCNRYHLPAEAPRIVAIGGTIGHGEPSAGARIRVERWEPETKIFSVDSASGNTLALKLLNYAAWRVDVNGKAVTAESRRDTAQILLPLPAGSSRIEVQWSRTPDRTAGGAISLLTVGALLAGLAFPRRSA